MYSEMKEPQPAFAVYSPPAYGFPFLAVVLEPDGTATAKPFDTAAEAVAFNVNWPMRYHGLPSIDRPGMA
jgi:hypothetical protein